MKLGWFKVSVVVGLISLFSNPLCALDFDREISKQNAKGKASSIQLQARSLNQPTPEVKERKSDTKDFAVELTTIKR